MARHKKYITSSEGPECGLEISSLIDVCFLLLIYFVVTSTITPRESDLGLSIPKPGPVPGFAMSPMIIHIDKSGVISGGQSTQLQELDTDAAVRDVPRLKSMLELYKQGLQATGENPIVRIQADQEASQQRVIDVFNALAGTGIEAVTIDELLTDE